MNHLVTEIQSRGVRVDPAITGRKGGAGPAEGRAFIINGLPVMVPIAADFVSQSPFSIRLSRTGGYDLLRNGQSLSRLNIVPEPGFYSKKTEDGIPFKKIALLHGKDCLASTVLQTCVHWKNLQKCRFCATEISLSNNQTVARKTPTQLAQVARAAVQTDGIQHMVLTSGTGDPPGSEIPYLAECVRTIKSQVDIPVQVQVAPPPDLDMLAELADAGVESVGIHIETFDWDVLERVAPAKARIGLGRYEKAWKKAVDLFGVNQVSSFIIAGLGESLTSIAWGSEFLADLGVYPFVVPLRPIPGSSLAYSRPPLPETMRLIYDNVEKILQRKGISIREMKAGCPRCGACSALPFADTDPEKLICHSARTEQERQKAFEIRRSVFVEEQGLFDRSDIDRFDDASIHLVAKQDGRIVGTVRVYKDPSGPDSWIGGRLAVSSDYRASRAGALLVKEAMKRVRKKGCRIFTALIQEKNIGFFCRLGWKPIGPLTPHFGQPHLKMQAELGLIPEDILI